MTDQYSPSLKKNVKFRKDYSFNLRDLLSDGGWALHYTFRRKRNAAIGLWLLAVLRSILPLFLVLATRGMINSVVNKLAGVPTDNTDIFFWLAAGLLFSTMDIAVTAIYGNAAALFQDSVTNLVTVDILEHISKLDLEQFESLRFQDTLGIAQQNASAAFGRFHVDIINLVSYILESAGLLYLLFRIDPWTMPILLPFAAVYLWAQWKFVGRKTDLERSRAAKRRWTRYITARTTGLEYLPEIKMLQLAPYLIRKYDGLMREFIEQDRKIRNVGFRIQSFFSLLNNSLIVILLWRVISGVRSGILTIGDLTIFGSTALRLRGNLDTTIQNLGGALESTIYITHLRILLHTQPVLRSTANYTPERCRGEFLLEDVSFTYPETTLPALEHVSLHIQPGEVVALVGENGAGKTTLVKLLSRLYSPTCGKILLDGRDLEEYSLEYLRRQYLFVFQNFGRYEGSVLENIAYGDWERLIDRPDLVETIARACGIDPIVKDLPHGYQTMLGRMFGETDLSGGQWQRIAIARAFAREGSILILDEPTSNLDPRAEYQIFRQFQSLAAGRTTILISHRFSTASMADRIIVLDQGRIAEQGSHASLLSQNGLYATLFKMQSRNMDTAG
jgi:ATP-binding cassette subfamily B protein